MFRKLSGAILIHQNLVGSIKIVQLYLTNLLIINKYFIVHILKINQKIVQYNYYDYNMQIQKNSNDIKNSNFVVTSST